MTGRGPASDPPDVVVARYLSEACHELRKPVAVLSLFSELGVAGQEPSPERRLAALTVVREQTAILNALIDRYLEHGQLVHGGWSDADVDAVVDVAVEVEASLDQLAPLVTAERVRRRLAPGTVFGDAARVRSIAVNLVHNAARYSPEAEPVEVDVGVAGPDVVLRVADRGIGIPADEREHVLQPFRRGKNATEEASAGVGLGLAIVAAHVEALDGRLEVSDRAGGGTVFAVRLPRSPAGAADR